MKSSYALATDRNDRNCSKRNTCATYSRHKLVAAAIATHCLCHMEVLDPMKVLCSVALL